MQDADLFLELAGVAGVFVGFGALIAVRNGGPTEVEEVAYMRTVVWMGMLTVVAALAPVTLGRYGLTDHEVWALSSAVGLAGFVLMGVVNARTPEFRTGWVTPAATRWTPGEIVATAAYVLYMIALVLTPVIVMLGVAPDLEAALYFTFVVLILLGAGWALLELVFAQRRPWTASEPAPPPPAGGSSARPDTDGAARGDPPGCPAPRRGPARIVAREQRLCGLRLRLLRLRRSLRGLVAHRVHLLGSSMPPARAVRQP